MNILGRHLTKELQDHFQRLLNLQNTNNKAKLIMIHLFVFQ